jgi:hypothetical protein
MKHNYHLRHLMAFLSFFYCFTASIFAQGTAPVAQDLPYTQDFSTLAHTATGYPAGFQGWNTATAPGSSYVITGTLLADRVLVANSTAATNSGNFHNYNGKIGFLNNSSLDLTIGLAIKTTGKTAINVEYDAMTIRNPYVDPTSTRINEMALQYRVGSTANFTTLPTTIYTNNTTLQTTGTTGQNIQRIKVLLPAECDNQDVVQIRWISKQLSGVQNRPSFAIDNIRVIDDVTPPVNAVGFPQISDLLSDGFDFLTKINEIGKTYFVLLASGSTAPSIAQIKAGTDATDAPAIQAAQITIADPSLTYTKNITGLTAGTTYVVYAVSEDASGNIQASSSKLDVTTSSALVPSLSATETAVDFSFVEQNFSSDVLNYQISGRNLAGNVTLTATGNFTISKDAATGFQTTLVFAASDFDSAATPSVYVKFTPNSTGVFSGQINHESTGASAKTVALSGTGINPYIQDFNDVNVLANSGWTAYSVTGDKIKWASQNTRFNSSPRAVQINGYTETGASKDWLISPKLRLDNFDKFPLLSFYSRKFFSGTQLKLMVSVNYDGKSSPETATWTPIEGSFPTITGIFQQSKYINLEAYKTNHTYLAWVYETTASGSGSDSSEWTFDDVQISNEATFLSSNPNLNFGEVTPNTVSTSQSFVFMAGGYGDITITAPTDFQISTDNINFQSSLVITAAEAVAGKTIFARFTPSVKTLTISGPLKLTGTALNQEIGAFNGSSITKTETFDIVTYNLEFFGTDVKDTGGTEFGPTNDALQIDNVATVMNTLNADVYAVQEVSDDAALDMLIQKISINGKTFDKVISPVWSRSFQAPDPNFPPQKLVVLYNTQTTAVKKSRVMFKKLYDEVRAGTKTLPNYPSTSESFYSSGRLPQMVEIETNINGVKKDLTIINLHARANSGSDIARYNMRKYDVELLKDSLDVNYPDANLIILGDYNDDVDESVIAGNPSSYQKMVEDTARYNPLTLEISKAGAFSYLSSGGFLDHIIISNELTTDYVANSTTVYDPRLDVTNYVNTTSDHGPVIARFELKADPNLSTNDLLPTNGLSVVAYPNPATESFSVVINLENTEDLKLNIYDILGRSMGAPIKLKSVSNTNATQIDIAKLPVGIYIYTLSNGNKVVFKDKIVKK